MRLKLAMAAVIVLCAPISFYAGMRLNDWQHQTPAASAPAITAMHYYNLPCKGWVSSSLPMTDADLQAWCDQFVNSPPLVCQQDQNCTTSQAITLEKK